MARGKFLSREEIAAALVEASKVLRKQLTHAQAEALYDQLIALEYGVKLVKWDK